MKSTLKIIIVFVLSGMLFGGCISGERGETKTHEETTISSDSSGVDPEGSPTEDVSEPSQPVVYGTFTDRRDGNSYRTVKIGDQLWMADNLDFAAASGSWCYDDNSNNCAKYGRLYVWKAALKACPQGWRLPSRQDFNELTGLFGGDGSGAYNALKVGGKSGFNASLGGWRDDDGVFNNAGIYGNWWSSTELGANTACNLNMLSYNYITVVGSNYKTVGHSVRCLQ